MADRPKWVLANTVVPSAWLIEKKSPAENFETVRTRYRTLKTTGRKFVIQNPKAPYEHDSMEL